MPRIIRVRVRPKQVLMIVNSRMIVKCGDLYLFCKGCELRVYDFKSEQSHFGGRGKITQLRSLPITKVDDDDKF